MKHDEPAAVLMRQPLFTGVEADLASDVRDRLLEFSRLLTRWNPTIRLVSQSDIPHLWARHVADSLQLVQQMPPAASGAVDLGSGGGFPGLILAIATGVHFDLIEADSRKAAFLQEAVIATKAPATIHTNRIEEARLEPRELVTARALAPLSRLLDLSYPFLLAGGVCLFPKGERADTEIADAGLNWIMDLQQIPSRTSPGGQILRIAGLRRRKARTA